MKDIEHPEFIIEVMIFNEYISDVCETQRLHPSCPPSSSLTDSWPSHIKAAKIPHHVLPCHLATFRRFHTWPWCTLRFLGKADTQKPQASHGVKQREKIELGDSASFLDQLLTFPRANQLQRDIEVLDVHVLMVLDANNPRIPKVLDLNV